MWSNHLWDDNIDMPISRSLSCQLNCVMTTAQLANLVCVPSRHHASGVRRWCACRAQVKSNDQQATRQFTTATLFIHLCLFLDSVAVMNRTCKLFATEKVSRGVPTHLVHTTRNMASNNDVSRRLNRIYKLYLLQSLSHAAPRPNRQVVSGSSILRMIPHCLRGCQSSATA
jgi:hypothetical protein